MSNAAFEPKTDKRGFAPTNRVVVKPPARKGGAVRFYRTWMKPGDLDYPPQLRRIHGPEERRKRAQFALQKLHGVRMDMGIVVDATPRAGGMPQTADASAEGGTPARKIFETLQEKFAPGAIQSMGGHARAAKMTREERVACARKAANTRWHGKGISKLTDLAEPLRSDPDYSNALRAARESIHVPIFNGDTRAGRAPFAEEILGDKAAAEHDARKARERMKA